MDNSKKAEFVRKSGKKRLSLYRGGKIKKYDSGGEVNTQGSGLAGSIGNLLGTENNFEAGKAPIQAGTDQAQLNTSYNQAQQGLGYQQKLLEELQKTNAIQNQNAAYNEVAGVAAGTGPNPAQTMLNQATGANVANQAALMAGQRGASANAGLIARQAAQQGAATQQQAAGQGATLEAQQQLNAIGAQANIAGQQVSELGQGVGGYNTAAQNEQNILEGANTALNNANVGMQSNINSTNAQVAAGNQQVNSGIMGGLMSGAAAVFGLEKGGEVGRDGEPEKLDAGGNVTFNEKGYDAIASGGNGQIPGVNPAPAPQNLYAANYGAGKSVGKGLASIFKGPTSTVPNISGGEGYMPDGSYNDASEMPMDSTAMAGGAGDAGGAAALGDMADVAVLAASRGGKICPGPHKSHVANYLMSKGGKVPAMVSPGEVYLSPEQVHKVVHEGANPMKLGQKFDGKAKVKGDSKKNDTIPVTLREGGIVIPRHIVNHKMAPEKAELFVRRAAAHKRMG